MRRDNETGGLRNFLKTKFNLPLRQVNLLIEQTQLTGQYGSLELTRNLIKRSRVLDVKTADSSFKVSDIQYFEIILG